ncbi:PAS domain-containing protein [Thermodesulfobacteriota bacterium]
MTTMSESNLSKILSNRKNLERILENLDVGIIAHDLSRQIFYFNEQAEKMAKVTDSKRPNDWSAEDKLKVVVEASSLDDEQLGAFLRSKGLHQTSTIM